MLIKGMLDIFFPVSCVYFLVLFISTARGKHSTLTNNVLGGPAVLGVLTLVAEGLSIVSDFYHDNGVCSRSAFPPTCFIPTFFKIDFPSRRIKMRLHIEIILIQTCGFYLSSLDKESPFKWMLRPFKQEVCCVGCLGVEGVRSGAWATWDQHILQILPCCHAAVSWFEIRPYLHSNFTTKRCTSFFETL